MKFFDSNWLRSLLAALGGAIALVGVSTSAQAVPSFARQTGQDCAACHVGSFGPQLTPYGMKFKLGGYTDSDGKDGHIPLSAMLVQTFTHTSKSAPEDVAPGFDRNNNLSLQEVSMFVAGRFTDNIGAFAQMTWGEPDRKTSIDNFDLRFVKPMQFGGKDTTLGISLNNNPAVQDPFNTVPAWKFPYMSSELLGFETQSPLIAGALEQQVLGATAYAFYDNSWYAELGGYQSLSKSMLSKFNVDPGDQIKGTAPYWRLAYFQDLKKQAYSVGLFGMNARMLPGFEKGRTDKYNDIGVDASYQFLGTRKHVFGVNGSFIHENRNLDASYGDGASKKNGNLNRFDLSGSYHYDKTYGVTLGVFDVRGNKDENLYGEDSVKNSPDSRGYIVQADWTPFGKEDSWLAPWANMRVGLQYTGYTKFNGSSQNYNADGRDASDNNTLYGFVWFAL